MLLSFLGIHGPNILRVTVVFFVPQTKCLCIAQWQSAGLVIGRSVPSRGDPVTHVYHSSVLFSGIKHLLVISFSGFKFFAILTVANFANIISNGQFCPVGQTLRLRVLKGRQIRLEMCYEATLQKIKACCEKICQRFSFFFSSLYSRNKVS